MIQKHAPAKLNLFLHVVGRRPDGYHLMESLFAFSHTGDVVSVEESDHLSLSIEGPFAEVLIEACVTKNLVYRAAELLAATSNKALGASIVLTKNLPIAAGIGGGSADAAATLLALNELWGLNRPVKELEALALQLGADVPACLYQRPLMVRGIGEDITPTLLKEPCHVLLVNPLKPVSTPAIFAAFKDGSQDFHEADIDLPEPVPLDWIKDNTCNSLTVPAKRLCPDISDVLLALNMQSGVRLIRMSGSGGTCFALFDKAEDAVAAKNDIQKQHTGWWLMQDQLHTG